MKVIILAAGRGSRMGDGTSEIPKCMMKLWNRPLLEMCMETLLESGINRNDIGIVTGYKAEKIKAEGVRYFHNRRWRETNMFYSLQQASEWLKREPCIVCYSDIVFHADAIRRLVRSTHDFAVDYYTGFMDLWKKRFKDPLTDLETFRIDCAHNITEIGRTPKSLEEIQGQYMGLIRFSPEGWRKVEEAVKLPMEKSVEKLDMTTLLQHLITCGYTVQGIPCDELWLECDNQEDIRLYESLYKRFD